MADIDTHYYIEWGCGRVAMRAVGGWAPSAKTHIHAGTLMKCPCGYLHVCVIHVSIMMHACAAGPKAGNCHLEALRRCPSGRAVVPPLGRHPNECGAPIAWKQPVCTRPECRPSSCTQRRYSWLLRPPATSSTRRRAIYRHACARVMSMTVRFSVVQMYVRLCCHRTWCVPCI